ncbi:hypothetical protein [Roseomonas sp. BN140053]
MDPRIPVRPSVFSGGPRRLAGFALMGGSLAFVSALSLIQAVIRVFH